MAKQIDGEVSALFGHILTTLKKGLMGNIRSSPTYFQLVKSMNEVSDKDILVVKYEQ